MNGFACSPGQLDFGNVLKGMSATLSVACTNVTNTAAELVVGTVQGQDRAQFTHRHTGNGGLVLVDPGETLVFGVVFLANRVGSATAEIELRTGAGARVLRVRLMGTGLDHAISCAPNSLDFGYVAPGTSVQRSIVCTNAASKAFAITGVALDPSSPRRFTWSPTAYPLSIPGQGSATINVSFSPVAEDAGGRKSGGLVIITDDPSVVRFDVQLTGFAGGPALTCTPSQLDFGVVAQGLPSTRSVVCANSGSGTELLVSDVATSAAEYAATVRGGFRSAGYAVGETFTVDVTYDPVDDSRDTATLTFASNAQNPSYAVALSGEGRVLPPCDLSIFPDSLRFGIVDRDDSATQEIRLQNHRNDAVCVVQDLALAATCNPAFSLPSGALPSATIPPGGELHVPVTFAPTVYGVNQTCELHFDVSNPNEPHRVVPIRGASQSPCLRFEPDHLDFGTIAPGCRSLEQQLRLINTCSPHLNIDEIGAYPDDADFHILAYPPEGTTIAAGLSMAITVAYAPQDEGPDTGAIFFRVVGTDGPYMVRAHGAASLSPKAEAASKFVEFVACIYSPDRTLTCLGRDDETGVPATSSRDARWRNASQVPLKVPRAPVPWCNGAISLAEPTPAPGPPATDHLR